MVMQVVIGALVLAVLFLLQKKAGSKGCFLTIVLWIVSLVALLLVFVFASPDDSAADIGTDSSSPVTQSSGANTNDAEAINYVYFGHSFSLYPSAENNYDYDNEIYNDNLEFVCSIFDQLQVSEDNEDPEGGKVNQIIIKNFQLTDGPGMGVFGGLTVDPQLNAELNASVVNGEVVFDTEAYSAQYSGWGASLCFGFKVVDIASYTYPENYDGSMSAEISFQNAGITSDMVRFGCSYDIELTTAAGDVYTKHVDISPLEGDFIYDGNMAVIDTPDALMVCPLNETQRIRQVVEKLKQENNKTYYEHKMVERPWGTYEILAEGPLYKIKRIVVKSNQRLSKQYHYHRSEHWIVVRGTAKVAKGEDEYYVHENESTYISKSVVHQLENPGHIPLEIIEIQCGLYLEEDDIVRLDDIYIR
jgi:mannose-6-phosphate isomerase-like protein (cupin superfamily)